MEELLLLSDEIRLESLDPVNTTGRYCDLFLAMHTSLGKVALKRPRAAGDVYHQQQLRQCLREADKWKELQHPNVLPFYGILEKASHVYLVSPWMDNGALPVYLRAHPSADRFAFVSEIADAIKYLHSCRLIHGDIKGMNILVSPDVKAVLCDFGLTKMEGNVTASSIQGAGSTAWMSPELLMGEPRSFASDVYAFGITLYEILSDAIPYAGHTTIQSIIYLVVFQGKRPEKVPSHALDGRSYRDLWEIAAECWPTEPDKRPAMADVVETLTSILGGYTTGAFSLTSTMQALSASGVDWELFHGEHPLHGFVALKRPSPGAIRFVDGFTQRLRKESRRWRTFKSSNLLPFLGMFKAGNEVYLMFPWVLSSLPSYLEQNPLANRCQFLLEAATGVQFLHESGLIHGNIKGKNILVSHDRTALVSDYGLLGILDPANSTPEKMGSLSWTSPEILTGSPRSFAGDIFAFGMTIYEILTDLQPFRLPKSTARRNRLRGAVECINSGERPMALFSQISPSGQSYGSIWDLANECWQHHPRARPVIRDVVFCFRDWLAESPSEDEDSFLEANSTWAELDDEELNDEELSDKELDDEEIDNENSVEIPLGGELWQWLMFWGEEQRKVKSNEHVNGDWKGDKEYYIRLRFGTRETTVVERSATIALWIEDCEEQRLSSMEGLETGFPPEEKPHIEERVMAYRRPQTFAFANGSVW